MFLNGWEAENAIYILFPNWC